MPKRPTKREKVRKTERVREIILNKQALSHADGKIGFLTRAAYGSGDVACNIVYMV